MNNHYISLTAMYRYGILYMAEKPSMEKIKHTLTTTNPHTTIPGSKLIVKKALNSNFGIKSRQDMDQVISDLINHVLNDAILNTALIDIYLNHSGHFSVLTQTQVETYLSEGNKITKYIQYFTPVFEGYGLDINTPDAPEHFKEAILYYFAPETVSMKEYLYALFEKNKSLLSYTNGFSTSGFDFSRIISIIADSCVSGYITEEEAEQLLNLHGSITESLFDGWESFLSSAILGKQMMSAASGTFILDSEDYMQSCYRLGAHPANILELTGIWSGSDLTRFSALLSEEYHLSMSDTEKQTDEANRSFNFVQSNIFPILEKYNVTYLFDISICEQNYRVPVADPNSDSAYLMQLDLKKMPFSYDSEEIPFMLNGKKLLITDKKIYIMEKKLFQKQTHVLEWSQKLTFTYKFSKWDQLIIYINDIKTFTLPRNYKRIGIGFIADSQFNKKEVMEHYGEEIKNAMLAFSEINEFLKRR